MMRNSVSFQLSDEQRRNICLLLSIGCDRETAAKIVRCLPVELRREMMCNAAFAADIRHAEGMSEVAHLRNVQNATQDVKNWRASVWWLERHSPERFGRRAAGTITTSQLQAFITQLALIVFEAVQDPHDRERLMERLGQMEGSWWESGLRDSDALDTPALGDNPKVLEEVELDCLASPDESELESDDDFVE